jgi:hypothetical protein
MIKKACSQGVALWSDNFIFRIGAVLRIHLIHLHPVLEPACFLDAR